MPEALAPDVRLMLISSVATFNSQMVPCHTCQDCVCLFEHSFLLQVEILDVHIYNPNTAHSIRTNSSGHFDGL